MIFYFSATGNSKHVAERLAAGLNTELTDIAEFLNSGKLAYEASGDEVIGIVSPVYFGGIPSIVKAFLGCVSLTGGKYTFCVSTYGLVSGIASKVILQEWNTHNRRPDAFFSVRMPDTYTVLFNASHEKANRKKNAAAEEEIDTILEKITSGAIGNHMRNRLPGPAGKAFHSLYGVQRRTSAFRVLDSCVGCGLCAQKCPAKAIEMKAGRPVWTKKQCIMCLGCLHRCPKFAIQNGPLTRRHGQYTHPDVEL